MKSNKTVVIVGGGFAGLAAARRLGRTFRTVLIDPRATSDFLPLLPDIVGGRLAGATTQYALAEAACRFGVQHVRERVAAVDVPGRRVRTSQSEFEFDHLVLACGSVTEFHGTEGAAEHAYTVKSAMDAERLSEAVGERRWRRVIVCGGGYTGVEIATHVKNRFRRVGDERPVMIVEALPQILTGMPDGYRRYTEANVKHMDIAMLTDTTIKKVGAEGEVRLSNGEEYSSALVAWSAGVKVPSLVTGVELATGRGGRIRVDDHLQFAPGCFAVGDAAHVERNGAALRMGIQFSLMGGYCAAENIVRHEDGRVMRRFNPMDPGYIIPMANNRSCGTILGVALYGRLATMLHYFMCAYRTWGLRNRARLLRELCGGRL